MTRSPGGFVRLLARIGRVLATPHDDLVAALSEVAALLVPELADACAIELDLPSGQRERIAVGRADTAASTRTVALVGRRKLGTLGLSCGDASLAAADGVHDIFSTTGDLLHDVIDDVARRLALFIEASLLREETTALADGVERAQRDLDVLTRAAGDDLRAPLRGIANLAAWIDEDSESQLTARSREHMALLRGRVRRLEDLIQGVIDYSRAGRVSDEPIEVDVRALVDDILDDAAALRNPALQLKIDPHLPSVRSAKAPLRQVLAHLIANALRFNTKPEPRLEIGAEPIANGWELYVRDNGPGIARRYHALVWELFQTLHSRDRIDTTGIGLAIVRRIVEAHGGHVWLDSDEGQGATFRFTWPDDPMPPRDWDIANRQR